MKNIVIGFWILVVGSYLWMMSKVKLDSLLWDWFIYVFTLFIAAFAGDILIKLINIKWFHRHWSDLAGLGMLFVLGGIIVLSGILLSSLNALGSPWPGFIIALIGIPYFYLVVGRIESKFRQLNA